MKEKQRPVPILAAEMMFHEYKVYHNNTNERVVATTMGYAATPLQAIEAALAYAQRWNWSETRPNMIVKFLECEGVKIPVKGFDTREEMIRITTDNWEGRKSDE